MIASALCVEFDTPTIAIFVAFVITKLRWGGCLFLPNFVSNRKTTSNKLNGCIEITSANQKRKFQK